MKRVWLALAFAALWAACKVPNLDHCYHQSAKPNTWCIENEPSRPYCSPCEEANGCVATEPSLDECPAYVPGTEDTGSGDETETDETDETETTEGDSASSDETSEDSSSVVP